MLGKIIEISTAGTRLSVRHRQLVIARPDAPEASVPVEDLGVVIVDDRQASYSHAVGAALMAAGAVLILSGPTHLPAGIMLPIEGHHAQAARHLAQVAASAPLRKRLWQAMIRAKIAGQAAVLRHHTGEDGGLAAIGRRVRSGDPDNLEAQAAQRYWPRLFGRDFRRDRAAPDANALLNYGYAVIRAAVARHLVGAGLIPALGVHHRHRGNSFCLADDLLEPFRPAVDWRVRALCPPAEPPPDLTQRDTRAALLSLFNETVAVGDRRLPLLLAIRAAAQSLALSFETGAPALALPEGLPMADVGPDDPDAGA